jgi:putative phage-type endonuclease
MMKGCHAMVTPVLDIAKTLESTTPFGNHPFFQKMWTQEVQASLNETSQEADISLEEQTKAEIFGQLVGEALSLFVREAENPAWIHMTKEQRLAKVQQIQQAPQIPQRSEEWFRQYAEVLTASEFSALFTQNKRRRDLVSSKAFPSQEPSSNFRMACPTEEMNAIGWGIRFEPVVKQLLEKKEGWTIYESGRLTHPHNPSLAASPDGLVASAVNPKHIGRLIEIKCPYSRTIGKEIPSDYWIQMQIQMEVSDIDECEYIEVELVSKRANQVDPVELSGTSFQGIVYLFKQIAEDGDPFDHKYIYGEIGSNEMPPTPQGYECVETIPWGLKAWHRKLVHRDRAWYESTKPWQETFWRDVECMKQGQAPAQKPKPTACLITDD